MCSVVIPAHNAAPFIADAIESVRRQTRAAWELVVVDDASTDETAATVRALEEPRLTLLAQERNRGVSAARNRGLAAASGEYVLFLDADDWLMPDALERLIGALAAHPEAAAAYGEAVCADASGRAYGTGQRPLFHRRPSGEVAEALLAHNFVVTPGVLCARTAAVRAAGGFDESVRVAEDWVLWCALARRGPFHYVPPPPVLTYRHSGQSVTQTTGFDIAETLACIEAAFAHPEVRAMPARRLRACRRKREAGAHAFVATQHVRARNFDSARKHLTACLRLHPVRPRAWILLCLCLARWLPAPAARRLK